MGKSIRQLTHGRKLITAFFFRQSGSASRRNGARKMHIQPSHEDLVALQGDGDGDQRFTDAFAVVADTILPAEAGVVDVALEAFVPRNTS